MNLFWTNTDSETCPSCGDSETDTLEANLTLHFEKSVKSKELDKNKTLSDFFSLEQCESCGALRCELSDLDEWVSEFALEQFNIERFSVDKTVTTASVATLSPSGEWTVQPWVEHADSLRLEKNRMGAPTPSLEVVLACPQSETEEWLLSVQALDYVQESPFSDAKLVYLAVIIDSVGQMRDTQMQSKVFVDSELEALLLRACANPPSGRVPLRPKALRFPDAELAGSLTAFLSTLDVPVDVVDVSIEDQIYQTFAENSGLKIQTNYFFKDAPESQIRDFTKAAKRFFGLKPWEFILPDSCIAFKLPNADWQYATVMGHIGESFGLAMFPSWLGFCQFIHNQGGVSPMGLNLENLGSEEDFFSMLAAQFMNPMANLERQGGIESFNACEMMEIPPRDMAQLQKLGIKPVFEGRFAFAQRFDKEGELVQTSLSMLEYTMLLEALTAGFKNSGSKLNGGFNSEHGTTLIKYPSLGLEDAPTGAFKLEFVIPKSKTIKRKIAVTIRASGTEKISKIAREVSLVLSKEIGKGSVSRIKSWHNEESFFWERTNSGRLDPSPLVFQIAGLEKVIIQLWLSHLPVKITPESASVPKLEIQIS
jgi:hypothetical protein